VNKEQTYPNDARLTTYSRKGVVDVLGNTVGLQDKGQLSAFIQTLTPFKEGIDLRPRYSHDADHQPWSSEPSSGPRWAAGKTAGCQPTLTNPQSLKKGNTHQNDELLPIDTRDRVADALGNRVALQRKSENVSAR
jgi:hypothetical protein